jgi:hypothetical protein
MSDYDRGPDRDRETIRDTERTTVVQTEGGRRGGGALLAIVLIILLLVLLFFLFGRGMLDRAGDEVGVNVDVDAPKVDVPDVDVKIPEEVKVEVPEEVRVETNSSR